MTKEGGEHPLRHVRRATVDDLIEKVVNLHPANYRRSAIETADPHHATVSPR
jgi:hypothetical protein